MKDKKFEDFLLEKSKEEIINAYRECIHNGEVLLSRIDKAIEYIEDRIIVNFDEYDFHKDIVAGIIVNELLDILKGSDKDE